MNSDNNGDTDEMEDFDDLYPEIEALKPTFISLIRERLVIEQSSLDDSEKRAAVEDIFKRQMRAAFLTHPLATEEDFERLWPRLRDDALCEQASEVYFQVIDALAEEMDDGF